MLAVFGAALTQKASILILTIVAARLLGASEFGKFAIIYATCVNLTGFVGDALAATMNRYVPLAAKDSEAAAHDVAGMILSFTLMLALLLSAAMLAAAPLLNALLGAASDLTAYLRLAALIVVLLLLNAVLGALLNTFGQYRAAATASISGAVAVVLLALLGAWRGGAFGMCLGFCAGTLVATLVYGEGLRKRFPRGLLSVRHLRRFIGSDIVPKFTLPTVATMALGGPVHWVCISFLAASKAGMHDVAVFTAFFQWYSIFTFIPAALMNFTIPWLAKAAQEGQLRRKSMLAIMAQMGGSSAFLLLMFIFRQDILGLYGADFKAEADVLLLLGVCGLFAALIAVMNQISWAAGKTWGNLLTASIYGAAYIAGSFIFIKILAMGVLGLVGAILVASLLQGSVQAWLALR